MNRNIIAVVCGLAVIMGLMVGGHWYPPLLLLVSVPKLPIALALCWNLVKPVQFIAKEIVGIQMILDLNRFAKKPAELEVPDTADLEAKLEEIIVTVSLLIMVFLI